MIARNWFFSSSPFSIKHSWKRSWEWDKCFPNLTHFPYLLAYTIGLVMVIEARLACLKILFFPVTDCTIYFRVRHPSTVVGVFILLMALSSVVMPFTEQNVNVGKKNRYTYIIVCLSRFMYSGACELT